MASTSRHENFVCMMLFIAQYSKDLGLQQLDLLANKEYLLILKFNVTTLNYVRLVVRGALNRNV